MTREEREEMLLDALWQLKELDKALEALGGHDEDRGALSDIRSVLEIEHAKVADFLWERDERRDNEIMKDYYKDVI